MCSYPREGDVVFLCLIWNDLMTSRMVFTSSVIVPFWQLAVNQLDLRFWRQISNVVPFLEWQMRG